MKKKIFGGIAVLALATVIGINVKMNSQENKLADISLLNVENLAYGEGTGNTGPGQMVDCAGWGSGSRKICMCTNVYDCTETSCG